MATIAKKLGPELGKKTFAPQVATAGPTGKPPAAGDPIAVGFVGLADDATGFDTQSMDDAKAMRESIEPLVEGTDLEVKTTGAAAQSLDSQESTESTMAIVGIATVVLIVVLLAIIFRSVIICLMPIVVVTVVSLIATGLIAPPTRPSTSRRTRRSR